MTVTMRPVTAGSDELTRMLERTERLAGLAERSDLVERLGVARAWLAGRPLRVAVAGGPADTVAALVGTLRRMSAGWLQGASFDDSTGSTARTGQPDVVLFVADAGREYDSHQLAHLARIRSEHRPVLGVLADFDARPDWREVQQADRRHLRTAGLDTPVIPLLPVSVRRCEEAWQRHDEPAVVASGVPQLLEFLRDRVGTPVDPALRHAVVAEVRYAVDQLGSRWGDELMGLQVAGDSPLRRQRLALAELERRQQLSAGWQIALSDGIAELGAQMDFDLRERLRQALDFAEVEIGRHGALRDWNALDGAVRERISQAALANHRLLRDRSAALAEQVAAVLGGAAPGAAASKVGAAVPPPQIVLVDPDGTMRTIAGMEAPARGNGLMSRAVNSLRGSYGGILMVGVLTSLAGLSLISVYSVGAGVLLGAFTFWEDRRNAGERRRAEAKVAAAKVMDDANFRIGDHQRAQLRAVHRTLRDHFGTINDARLREAAEAVRAAAEPVEAAGAEERTAELRSFLAELDEVRAGTEGGARHRMADARV